MRRQGYVYNRVAANLRQRVSSAVALVINDLSNPFFAEFAAGVDEALGAEGFITLLGSSNESPERQRQVLGSLMEHRPSGNHPVSSRVQRRCRYRTGDRSPYAAARVQP